MCLCTAQLQYMGSSRCVCVLLSFNIWVAMCLCTAQLQYMGSYVFVYCPGSSYG